MSYTWTDNPMVSGPSGANENPDIVNENLMHLKYDNSSNFLAQCVNFAKTNTTGQADFIGAGTGLKPSILAADVDLIGNGQYGDSISKFSFNTDFNLPNDAPINRRSTILYRDFTGLYPSFVYLCQRPQYGSSFDVSKNLLMDFSSSLTLDQYGNTVTTLGNPTLSGGKYVGDGTGDGLKVTTITTLGTDKWCIEGRFKFNNTNALLCLFGSKSAYGMRLYRNASNKLELYLSSNGSSNDLANATLGSKANYNTSTEYHIALEFDGSTYKVYVDGVLDQTITSSTKIYSTLTALLIGIGSDESLYSLNGTIDDLRITIGNTRYGGAFTAPEVDTLTTDAYWFDTVNKVMKRLYLGEWQVAASAVPLGEITTNATTVTNAISYAIDGKQIVSLSTTSGNTATITHNLGTDSNRTMIVENNVQKYKDVTRGQLANTYSSTYTGTSLAIVERI